MPSSLRIPHAPLSDAEWAALHPHLRHAPAGRPSDRRAHFDAIFRVAATDGPWRDLPEEFGRHATVARYFRRLAHAGFWEHLLLALAAAPRGHPLRRLEGLICRACRRAVRLRGLRIIVLARRLGLKRALPAPPWLCPDPDLSEKLFALPLPRRIPRTARLRKAAIAYLGIIRKCLTIAAGRRHVPRALLASWP